MFGLARNNPISSREPEAPSIDPNDQAGDEKFTKMLSLVEQSLQRINSMQNQIDEISSRQRESFPKPDEPTHGFAPNVPTRTKPRLSEMSDEELEAMPRKEYLSRMSEEMLEDFSGAMKEALEPIAGKLSTVEQSAAKQNIQTEYEKFVQAKTADGKPKYPAFEELRETMKAINGRTQGLSLGQMYNLAMQETQESNPKLYEQIQQKHNPKPELKSVPRPSFGGLPPNLIGSGSPKGNMPVREAAAKVMGEMLESAGPLPSYSEEAS